MAVNRIVKQIARALIVIGFIPLSFDMHETLRSSSRSKPSLQSDALSASDSVNRRRERYGEVAAEAAAGVLIEPGPAVWYPLELAASLLRSG